MKPRSVIMLGLMVLMVGATAAFLLHVRGNQKLGQPGVKLADIPIFDNHGRMVGSNSVQLPERLLNYTSETRPVDEVVLGWLPKDTTYGQRLYEAPDGFKAQFAVVLMGTDRTSIHKPQYCLPAQGWKIETTEVTTISISQPHPYTLPVMKIVASQQVKLPNGQTGLRRGINLYWFVTHQKFTPHHNEWMWSMMKHLVVTGELERWAYVTTFALCAPGEEQAACDRLKEIVAAAVPHFQHASGPQEKIKLSRSQ